MPYPDNTELCPKCNRAVPMHLIAEVMIFNDEGDEPHAVLTMCAHCVADGKDFCDHAVVSISGPGFQSLVRTVFMREAISLN